MLRNVIIAASMFISIAAQAQNNKSMTSKKGGTAQVNNTAAPQQDSRQVSTKWTNAEKNVYYPDYYVFYDANRKGYVYQDSAKRWAFSEERPFFMKEVDLGSANIQILKDQTVALPDDQYEQYLRLYPAQNMLPSVPVPIITVQPGKK